MSITTLDNGTYKRSDEEDVTRDMARSQNALLEIANSNSAGSNSGATMSLYHNHDELSEYSETAKLSILRGLRQEPSNSLGSFAEYID